MILCEPFTVFYCVKRKIKKKKRALTTEKKGKIETEYSQWWSFNAICTHNRNRALTTC